MKRLFSVLAGIAVTLIAVLAGANLTSVSNAATPVDKVGVCHRTAAETNPYVFIEVPAAQANGHITGTGRQHNHKVYWDDAGTWRGVPHNAGDERKDYFAATAAECEDTVVTTSVPTITDNTSEPTTPVETTDTTTTTTTTTSTTGVPSEPTTVVTTTPEETTDTPTLAPPVVSTRPTEQPNPQRHAAPVPTAVDGGL